MTPDIAVEGNIYLREKEKIIKCCIGIEDGKIVELKKTLKGEKNLDFGENLILPAGVDIHVHFRDPGLTHKEDFFTGTVSAAYGGVSCVFDMPNTIPPINTVKTFKEKFNSIKKKACIDFSLYANGLSNEIEKLAKLCAGFKIYLYEIESDEQLKEKLNQIKDRDKLILLHAEDKNFIKDGKPKNLSEYCAARPNECEYSAIQKILGSDKNLKIHLCHVSAKESIDLLKKLKSAKVTSEVTPHHLMLNSDSAIGALGKVNPPLRMREDSEALWNALKNGFIDIVASDHAPHTLNEKKDFSEALSGVPGVETTFPLLLYNMKKEVISLSKTVEVFCEKPAEIFGLKKGKIQLGYDADFIVVDLKQERRIKSENLHSKCMWTPFENFTAIFPSYTFVRGMPVIEEFEFAGEKGFGKFVGGVENV